MTRGVSAIPNVMIDIILLMTCLLSWRRTLGAVQCNTKSLGNLTFGGFVRSNLTRATGAQILQLGKEGKLEQCLKSVEPRWQSDFCNVQHQPNGAPTLLLVGPSAAGANDLIKQLPTFNKVGNHSYDR